MSKSAEPAHPVINHAPSQLDSDDNILRFEYEILIEEYRMVNDRIARRQEAEEKGFEITAITITAVVAAGSLAITHKIYSLLLILAVPFHVLILQQIRRVITSSHLVKYITEILAPRLNEIIQRTSTDHKKYGKPFRFESWESYVAFMLKRRAIIGFVPWLSGAGRLLLQLGVVIVLLIGYFFLRQTDRQYLPSSFDIGLVVLNILAILVSLFFTIVGALYSHKSRRKLNADG